MKKIFVLGALALMSTGVFAGSPNVISEKVLKSFKETFTNAEQVKWHESDNSYSVRFFQAEVRYIVYYDLNGNITSSMRFYNPSLLPKHILNALQNSYSKKTAFGVTEITSGEDVAYFVRLEDSKHWYTIKFNASGESETYEKLKKQQ